MRVVRWAFVSGKLAHAWAYGDMGYATSLCGNRSERIVTVDHVADVPFGERCAACARKAPKGLVMKAPREWPAPPHTVSQARMYVNGDLALAWPDEAAEMHGGRRG